MYALLPKADWDHVTPIHECGGAIIVHTSELSKRVRELSGSDALDRYASIRTHLRRTGRVFIQGRRGGELGSLLVARVPERN